MNTLGPWIMILLAGTVLAALAVALPVAIIAALKFFENIGARSRARVHLELSRIGRRLRTRMMSQRSAARSRRSRA